MLAESLIASSTARDSACTQKIAEDSTITVYYDPDIDRVVMNAVAPTGGYYAWGWGASMTDTEMVMFSANGADSNVQYFWSTIDSYDKDTGPFP